ncbi:2-oxo-4-hydroxy-4-carboxy-5-ureidoimidazoline decarboxylase-like [Scleropages formosus]|uniref:2-oxo-4-hydroxy-4-carboxy-5-ureidoimidazoline decarboxylase n=1 Tax=Scleropages formosus TaxID=113540 RepID=A0A0P7WNR6_SCLFO|nr:2-oxo-4-hydroxy-4-carboxy-5-ureidoimidazoline decarboxylase-like [Scleropages formosus]
MDIGTVNSLSYEDFVDVFGNIVEKCPLVAAAVWSQRPFSNLAQMETAVNDFIDSLTVSGKEGVLRCHPCLAGRELHSGSLTADSREEQRQAGLTSLDPAEAEHLQRLNVQYKQRFGFPFVICARLNDRATIEHRLVERLANEPTQELRLAIEEVKKICRLRLQSLVAWANKL